MTPDRACTFDTKVCLINSFLSEDSEHEIKDFLLHYLYAVWLFPFSPHNLTESMESTTGSFDLTTQKVVLLMIKGHRHESIIMSSHFPLLHQTSFCYQPVTLLMILGRTMCMFSPSPTHYYSKLTLTMIQAQIHKAPHSINPPWLDSFPYRHHPSLLASWGLFSFLS